MQLLLPPSPGHYLVDLFGAPMVLVPAVSPRDAFQLAKLAIGTEWPHFPARVYHVDPAGELLEVYAQ